MLGHGGSTFSVVESAVAKEMCAVLRQSAVSA